MVSGGALRLWAPFFHKKISLQRIELFLNKKGTLAFAFSTLFLFKKILLKSMHKKINYFRGLSFQIQEPRLSSFSLCDFVFTSY